MERLEYYPVEVLRKPFNWKDKRTIIRNLKRLGVAVIFKAGKAWFSIDEFNSIFKNEPSATKSQYSPKSSISRNL